MKVLFILNHPPYGTEHSFNALRLAGAMAKKSPEARITVFLMADSVLCAKTGQKTPDGYYNIERMLKRILTGGGEVLLCGVCMDARALTDSDILEGARRSSMDELAENTLQADKVLVF
ncbi:MAG: DsrE/DsrF/TusD sulfur relay family protein [Novosphingobium sp.]